MPSPSVNVLQNDPLFLDDFFPEHGVTKTRRNFVNLSTNDRAQNSRELKSLIMIFSPQFFCPTLSLWLSERQCCVNRIFPMLFYVLRPFLHISAWKEFRNILGTRSRGLWNYGCTTVFRERSKLLTSNACLCLNRVTKSAKYSNKGRTVRAWPLTVVSPTWLLRHLHVISISVWVGGLETQLACYRQLTSPEDSDMHSQPIHETVHRRISNVAETSKL